MLSPMLSPAPSPAEPPLPFYLQTSMYSSSDDPDNTSFLFRYYPVLIVVVAIAYFATESYQPNPFYEHRRLIREHERRLRRQQRLQQQSPQSPPPPPPPTPAPPPGELGSVVCTYRIEKSTLVAPGNGRGSDCAICLEDFKFGEECQLFLSCNHGFHKACIDQWLALDRHCPLCRGAVRGGPTTNLDQV